MNRRFNLSRAWILPVLLLASVGPGWTEPDTAVTLAGSYVWTGSGKDRSGELSAVFTPALTDTGSAWKVAFAFDWKGERTVFVGTATGNLSAGPLSGEVQPESEEHHTLFRFTGDVVDGQFTGTHARVGRENKLHDTGTLTLSP